MTVFTDNGKRGFLYLLFGRIDNRLLRTDKGDNIMNNKVSKLFALALAASMVLTGCGDSSTENKKPSEGGDASAESNEAGENEIKDLYIHTAANRELETFNVLASQRQEDSENLCNLVDGLLESDPMGRLAPCLAESWETTDGGLTWTFHIRDGVKWVDVNGQEKADCNAQDFATGLEWVMNFHKNDSNNTSMPNEMIAGAREYYEYTKTLSKEEAYALNGGEGSKFREMVGIEIPDDHTVVYKCITPKPYFASVGTYSCLYPMAQGMVEELGGVDEVKAMNNETMWYNGCYTMTTYVQGNEKVFTKNPMYWDTEAKLFDSVTKKMLESPDVAFQLFENGEIDEVGLSEANLKIISDDANHRFYDYRTEAIPSQYCYQYHWNYQKLNEDGTPDKNWNTAIANTAFRQSIYYGIDHTDIWKRYNAINPMKCENLFYTMKGLCYTSDGKDYTELVREDLGLAAQDGATQVRYNPEKAEELKKQAIEELTALGVTFPVEMDYYIPAGNQPFLDSANVTKQVFTNCLGSDYIDFQIKTYVSKLSAEVLAPQLQSYAVNGWAADYGDPQNYLSQECYGYEGSFYSSDYSNINKITEETPENKQLLDDFKTYTAMVEEADKITDDMDARYAAYAKAEAFLLDKALVIPQYYNAGWALTKINPHSKQNAMFGSVNPKMKNWETKADAPYTTAEMEEIVANKTAKYAK